MSYLDKMTTTDLIDLLRQHASISKEYPDYADQLMKAAANRLEALDKLEDDGK